MFRRSASNGDMQGRLSVNSWDRPLPVQIAGYAILISAALMLLAGAYREEADLIRAGLLALSMGAVIVPGVFRKSWIIRFAFCALALIGVFYALTT